MRAGRAPAALGVLAIALLLAAAALALAHGGGRASGIAVAASAVLAAAAALALALAGLRQGEPGPRVALVALALALPAWGALGALPLPAAIAEALAPRRAALERAVPRGADGIGTWVAAVSPRGLDLASMESAEASLEAPRLDPAGGPPQPAPASYAPWATRVASIVLLAHLLLAVSLAGRSSERPALAATAGLMTLTLAAALAAAWFSRATPGLLFGRWAPPETVGLQPYGSFWSSNHAAALFALACPVLLACALDAGRAVLLRVAAALALLPVAFALLDAGSRGGLLAGGLAAILLGLGLLRDASRSRRVAGGLLLAGAAAGLLAAFTVYSERVIGESFEETTALQGSNLQRRTLYEMQVRMVRDAPLVGTGLGAFRTAQAAFGEEPDSLIPLHGESDWLETAAEGGIPLLAGWAAFVALLLAPAAARVARGGAPPLLAGLVAGALACIAHAAVDFHLREPLVALAAIAVAAASHAWARRLQREEAGAAGPAATAPRVARPRRRGPVILVAAAVVALIASVMVSTGEFKRDPAFRAAEEHAVAGQGEEAAAAARRAAAAAPRNGDAWALLGWAEELMAARSRPGRERQQHREAAVAASVRAIELSPAAFGAARRCAEILLQAGADEQALQALRLALVASPGQGPTHRVAGRLLLRHGPSEEALAHLGFAFRALPLPWIHLESPRLTAWMIEAAGGDVVAAMRHAGDADRIVWFVAELYRFGREQELRDCLRALAASPPPNPGPLAALVVLVGGPESAALARALLPDIEAPLGRQRLGMALVKGGDPGAGVPLIREGLEAGVDSPEAWLLVADGAAALGDVAAARAAIVEGAARHPGSPALASRLRAQDDRIE